MPKIDTYSGIINVRDDSPTTTVIVSQFTETLNRHGVETDMRHAAHDTIVFLDGQTNWPGIKGVLTTLTRSISDAGHDMSGTVTRQNTGKQAVWRYENGRVLSSMSDAIIHVDMYDLLHDIPPIPMPENLTLRFTGRVNGDYGIDDEEDWDEDWVDFGNDADYWDE